MWMILTKYKTALVESVNNMSKPTIKTYIITVSDHTETDERKFERVLELWRKEKEVILCWQKLETIANKYGDEE